jgi:hypothetical protein
MLSFSGSGVTWSMMVPFLPAESESEDDVSSSSVSPGLSTSLSRMLMWRLFSVA